MKKLTAFFTIALLEGEHVLSDPRSPRKSVIQTTIDKIFAYAMSDARLMSDVYVSKISTYAPAMRANGLCAGILSCQRFEKIL